MSGQDGQTLQIELGESGGKVGAAVQTEWSTESNDLSLHVIFWLRGLATNIICSFGGQSLDSNRSQAHEVTGLCVGQCARLGIESGTPGGDA